VSEAQFQATVIAMCRLLRIDWHHAVTATRDAVGWPDLAMVGDRGFLLRELKTDNGRLTRRQQEWGDRLRRAGISWDVWRPADLSSGRIKRELEAIR
jgi:hypothetical protein